MVKISSLLLDLTIINKTKELDLIYATYVCGDCNKLQQNTIITILAGGGE